VLDLAVRITAIVRRDVAVIAGLADLEDPVAAQLAAHARDAGLAAHPAGLDDVAVRAAAIAGAGVAVVAHLAVVERAIAAARSGRGRAIGAGVATTAPGVGQAATTAATRATATARCRGAGAHDEPQAKG
jgi:hypothetical protein